MRSHAVGGRTGKPSLRIDTKDRKAVGRVWRVPDLDLALLGHHHTKIFFELLRGKVDRRMRGDLVNAIHDFLLFVGL